MSKFEIPLPRPKKSCAESAQVAFRLPDDLREDFYRKKDLSGLSMQQFVSAMIRHCLKDIPDTQAESGEESK